MAIAYVASVGRTSTGTTSAIDTTGANAIFITICINSGNTPLAPTDSKGNTYILAKSQVGGAGQTLSLYYCQNATVGSGHTFTLATGTFNSDGIQVAAFSGLATSSILDVTNGAVGSGFPSSIAPGSITPNQNNSLIIAGAEGDYSGTTITGVDSGFAFQPAAFVTTNGRAMGLAYFIQGTAAAINPTFSLNQVVIGNTAFAVQGAFKPAGVAAASFQLFRGFP